MPAPKGNKHAVGNPGGGAPSRYEKRFAKMAEVACKLGATDRQVGELLGFSEQTINNWKNQHVDFALALKIGKEISDERVQRSLYNRAVGYSFDSEKIVTLRDGDSSSIERVPIVEHVYPDTTACIFWLKNRRPDIWRDRIEHTGNIDSTTTVNVKMALPEMVNTFERLIKSSYTPQPAPPMIEHDPEDA